MNLEKYKKTGDFTLSSGEKSDFYYDLKEAMGDPLILKDIIEKIIKTHNFDEIDVIIGIEYGGVPLAVGVSIATGKPFAVLRKKKKAYGTEKRIEGYQGFGKVLLLDDVKTTGGSIEKAKEYLFDMGYRVVAVDVAYTRTNSNK